MEIPIIKIRQSHDRFDGLMQERRNSIANALELRLSCTNPSILSLSWEPCTYKEGLYIETKPSLLSHTTCGPFY